MSPSLRTRAAALMAAASLVLTGLGAPGPATAGPAAPAGTLRVSPDEYVGGQMLTFSGNIGRAGVRTIHLEAHLGRDGDSWAPLPGSTARTAADGSFSFDFRAPSMFNIKYRAASGRLATDPLNFHARSQDLVLEVPGRPQPGQAFTLVADTTPELARRPDTDRLPTFVGRTVTLERRDGVSWTEVAETQTDQQGHATFDGIVVDQPGTVVYRAVQQDWSGHDGRDRIGWMPSFPTYVEVGGATPAQPVAGPRPDAPAPSGGNGDVKTATAAEVFGWRPALWDFAWVAGESLSSPPYRGKGPLVGWWLDTSTGTGRAAKHNGGLELDSQRANIDDDATCRRQHEATECLSVGTTAATLQGLDRSTGRWEVRVRTKSTDHSRQDFQTAVELVPAADPGCAGQTITIGQMTAHGDGMRIGVRSSRAGKQWSRTVPLPGVNNVSMTIAVEVSRKRISWFHNGRVVGSLRNRAAVPGVPLTLRLAQVGDGEEEMNRTQTIFDWMRGFDLDRGKVVTKGPRLTGSAFSGSC